MKLISPAAGKDEQRCTEPQHWNVLDQLRLDSLFKTTRVWDLGFMNSVNVPLKKKIIKDMTDISPFPASLIFSH